MATVSNLIPMNRRTKEEVRAITSKGGKRSGEVRAAMKTFKEAAIKWRNEGINADRFVAELGLAMLEEHNMKAAEIMIALCGEKAEEKINVQGDGIAAILAASKRLVDGE